MRQGDAKVQLPALTGRYTYAVVYVMSDIAREVLLSLDSPGPARAMSDITYTTAYV